MKYLVSLFLAVGCLLTVALGQDGWNVALEGRWPYGPCNSVAAKGRIGFLGSGSVIKVVDVNDPSEPKLLKEVILPAPVQHLLVQGALLFVAAGEPGLFILDISDPVNPETVGVWKGDSWVMKTFVFENLAFVVLYENGVQILDISDPRSPQLLGAYAEGFHIFDFAVHGKIGYLMRHPRDIEIVQFSPPEQPVQIGILSVKSERFHVHGDRLYTIDDDKLDIYDLSNPVQPEIFESIPLQYPHHRELQVVGNTLFLIGSQGLEVIDNQDPANSVLLGLYEALAWAYWDLYFSDSLLFVRALREDVFLYDFSDIEAGELKWTFEMPYVVEGIAVKPPHALVWELRKGLRVFDVGDPTHPVELNEGELSQPFGFQFPVDIVWVDRYAYISTPRGELRVYDLMDPTNPKWIDSLVVAQGVHDLFQTGQRIYVAAGDAGMLVFDISDPAHPKKIREYKPGVFIKGIAVELPYIYLLEKYRGLRIYDFSNWNYPKLRTVIDDGYFTDGEAFYLADRYLYMTIANGSARNRFLIYDVRNPDEPELTGSLDLPGRALKVVVRGGYAYVSSRAGGLQIVDVRDPYQPLGVGYFDTGHHAGETVAEGDLLFVTDSENGFYILRNQLPTSLETVPRAFGWQVFPNPISQSATVELRLERREQVSLRIYDLSGRMVKGLVNGLVEKGVRHLQWDGTDERGNRVAAGVYVVRFEASKSNQVETRRIVLLR